ncbi:peptide chain release factor 3 [Natronogracilivirga saccharolytica]|uniref:Peptide chain release factor 3 n=1 Tax=Natronogracilivirga saccharolytica TaxID=2812953 RepID=A0A8J7UVS1_9BACT|nr:peptide chain release factor 3 [Natronogracilivirga saccharolytica]MBP3192842.1 peptide chain release factor 3 [Natronogracilivirga saccharolytica]
MPEVQTKVKENGIAGEVASRRTFAIISHPDAGKTTLTEKLLLYGGAIHEAGSIKQRKAARHAASDWMAIEQERGISVTSSVLRFEKDGIRYNLLDTPGHKDFSEDTFRTLIAADCALMVIDVAKGVEEQTEKLFEVCRLRKIPVITFVNKCDRPGMEPLEVLSNIEEKLGVTAIPASWPIGYGADFQGVYDLIGKELNLYKKNKHGALKADAELLPLEQGLEESTLGQAAREAYFEELELIGDEFDAMDRGQFQNGEASPVFFGSALNNFGLDLFLNYFRELAPAPKPYENDKGELHNLEKDFSGFVFKLQANMNPEHRDCTAFVRVTSGMFKRGMEVKLADNGRKLRMATPHSLMGEERKLLDTAYPGDIVALFNPGDFRIGSTLYYGEPVNFDVIPLFSPEHFRKATSKDPFKRKQLREGLKQLSEEGVVNVFEVPGGVGNELLLGTVGALQFEVVEHRMKTEYKAEINLTPTTYIAARWLPDDEKVIAKLKAAYSTNVTFDIEGHPIVLFESMYALNTAVEAVGEENLLRFKK